MVEVFQVDSELVEGMAIESPELVAALQSGTNVVIVTPTGASIRLVIGTKLPANAFAQKASVIRNVPISSRMDPITRTLYVSIEPPNIIRIG